MKKIITLFIICCVVTSCTIRPNTSRPTAESNKIPIERLIYTITGSEEAFRKLQEDLEKESNKGVRNESR